MRFVIQRTAKASVEVSGELTGSIEKGFMVLIGVSAKDTRAEADKLTDKLLKLRIFEDENGKTNLSLKDVSGSLLLISQFTLYADCHKGNRPSFINAGSPEHANELYEYIVNRCREELDKIGKGQKVETGIFGAEMKVSLINDGPFTVILDSDEI